MLGRRMGKVSGKVAGRNCRPARATVAPSQMTRALFHISSEPVSSLKIGNKMHVVPGKAKEAAVRYIDAG